MEYEKTNIEAKIKTKKKKTIVQREKLTKKKICQKLVLH